MPKKKTDTYEEDPNMEEDFSLVETPVEDSPVEKPVEESPKEEAFCICAAPWCEAVRRLGHGKVRSVRIYSELLFATTEEDHVEVQLGAYSG